MAVALGYVDADRLAEAMYALGRGEAGTLRELLVQRGWLDGDALARIDKVLEGGSPCELLLIDGIELGEELGTGAYGRVRRARDRRIGRTVAVKTLHETYRERPDVVARFLLEAQLAGQLTHPNIVPVYALGALPGGELYYAMKEVEGDSLHDVLAALRAGDEATAARYTLFRMVVVLRQVCLALAYAHAQGVVHRDVKPHNVMLGNYGEVLLADWGSAKLVHVPDEDTDSDLDDAALESTTSSLSTRAGKVKGTPSYMAPEQAAPDSAEVGPLADVYAVGAVLYEVLCLRPPFSGDAIGIVLEEVRTEMPVPPSSRAPGRAIPAELEELAMQCLAKDPGERPAPAVAVIEQLDGFLDGSRRRQEAQAALADAETALERFEELDADLQQAECLAERGSSDVAPWAGVELKRDGWEAQRRRRDLRRRREEAYNQALGFYQRALGSDPNDRTAREGLADLYWRKFEEAEQRGDEEATEFFRSQVLLVDDGRYRRELGGMPTMEVTTDPPGAEVTLHRCEEQDLVMVPSLPRALGVTPTEPVKIAQGSYVVELALDDYAPVRLALFGNRPGRRRYRVRLRRSEEVGEGYVHVPGGRFLWGGDPRVPQSWPRRPVLVPDFAIARYPVTLGQYLEFLRHVVDTEGRGAALLRAPRTDARGRRVVRWDDARETVAPIPRHEYGEDYLGCPVTSISYDDATAYARWRSEEEGRLLRLPSGHEWEKAARGVDGRLYPWGDVFEPTYCNCRNSREAEARLEPVGSFPTDASPYGVRDLAGGVMEWCSGGESLDVRTARGGAWNRTGRDCSVVGWISLPPWQSGTAIGMRLVAPLMGAGRF